MFVSSNGNPTAHIRTLNLYIIIIIMIYTITHKGDLVD